MKRILTLLFLTFLGIQLMANTIYVVGVVTDEEGNPVPEHAIYLTFADSISGFSYSNTVYTNEYGNFNDDFEIGDVLSGEMIASTESCNDMITQTQFFNGDNWDLLFDFQICTDTIGGGGNDTIVEGCENYFYYYQEGLEVQFFGEAFGEGDATFTWNFGDGTTGDGMEVTHTYAEEGSYEVSLVTVMGDTCEFISYQTIYVTNDSIISCLNDFNYTVDNMTLTANGFGLDNSVVVSYEWSFGDGGSAEGEMVSHEYAEAGDYYVTLTTTTIDTCVAVTTKLISINGGGNTNILYGTVSSGNAHLDYGTAKLYSIVSDTIGGDNDIVFYDETTIDSAGMYFFFNVPQGSYLILAQADQQSVFFDHTLPTYYGDVIHWVDASIVVLGEPMNPYDINLVISTGANSGESQINGDVIGEGFKSQLIEEEIVLFLLDENNNALEFTMSELNSEFDFSDLAFGSYIVYAEVIGIPTEPGMVTLSADNPVGQINIVITPNGVLTGIDDLSNIQISGNIYPNPADNYARIDLDLVEAAQVELTLLNQMGQVLHSRSEYLNTGINQVELNTRSYPAGVYFIRIKSERDTINQKFIKK